MIRAGILSICVALAAIGEGGCGGASPAASDADSPTTVPRFVITKIASASTARGAYTAANRECRPLRLRAMAETYGVPPVALDVARTNAYAYRSDLRPVAELGCVDGFAGRHRPIAGW